MATILESPSRSLAELRLLPGFTSADGGPQHVSLATALCRSRSGADGGGPGTGVEGEFRLEMPIVGAAMQAVTGPEMAIALAQLGGIGVLPVSQPVETQCEAVATVKRFKAGFQTDLVTLSPEQPLAEVCGVIRATGYTTFPVTDTGRFHGRLLGVLTDKDFDGRRDGSRRVADRMRKDVQVAVEVDDLEEANALMIEYGRGFLPVVSMEGTLQSVVFKRDRDKHLRHPGESVDSEHRLRVAAAVSTHPEDRERIQALLEHDVDVLFIDASDGHGAYQAETLSFIKSATTRPVVAGNVVTREGFDFLVAAGADAVKVGMGIGSGCTTQSVKATGRGQATAIAEVAAARDLEAARSGHRIPLIADGGILGTAEAVVALALGADSLMLGNFLARYEESPGRRLRGMGGDFVKEYWMEGSQRAHNARRYAQSASRFFEEGVEGTVPYAGSVYDGLTGACDIVRAAFATAGCESLAALHERAVLEPVSGIGYPESDVRGLVV